MTLQLEFHSPDFHAPTDLVEYTREKLLAKLGKHRRRMLSVMVMVRDVNGTKRGPAISCHMQAHLSGIEPVIVEEHEGDLRAALDVTIDALDVAVQRHVERARSRPRNEGRKLVRHRKLAGVMP